MVPFQKLTLSADLRLQLKGADSLLERVAEVACVMSFSYVCEDGKGKHCFNGKLLDTS